MAKYCKKVHPVVKGWQYTDSHIWRRMVSVREKVEPQIEWKIGEGKVSVWWDNWSGVGALAQHLNLRGKGQSKEKICEGFVNDRLDLAVFGVQNQIERSEWKR